MSDRQSRDKLSLALRSADALAGGGVIIISIWAAWGEHFHRPVRDLLPVAGAMMVMFGWAFMHRMISQLAKEIAELKKDR